MFNKVGGLNYMLVLSRHRDESIIIEIGGVRVVVSVIDVRGSKVRLGIEAPKEVIIHREEIWNKIYGHTEEITEACNKPI